MNAGFAEGGAERIRQQARVISGLELPAERETALLETLAAHALGHCGRGDVPEEMEGALAVLLAGALCVAGTPLALVSSVKRGDTAITYDRQQPSFEALLAPFVRLRSPERSWKRDAGA
mgnify:CR=1 FL=1